MHLHFIGIGGIGMSALAQWCAAQGHRITGFDAQHFPLEDRLRAQGISLSHEVQPEIVSAADRVIFSEAIPEDHPERVAAQEKGIPLFSYFEYLGEITKPFKTIAVAGTHGKTTTVGLIASGCLACSFFPHVIVGALLPIFQQNNVFIGKEDYFLLEACEYRENFRFLSPEILVITNIDFDHGDYFASRKDYNAAFLRLAEKAKSVLVHEEDITAQRLFAHHPGYVKAPAHDAHFWKTHLSLFGKGNRTNADLALALAEILHLPKETFLQGLKAFKGAWRRQEFLGNVQGIHIFDDYAHHPKEIVVTLEAFRERFPGKSLGVIFQVHQHQRLKDFFPEFVSALSQADFVGIMPVYAARDDAETQKAFPHTKLLEALPQAKEILTSEDVRAFLSPFRAEDVLIFMGAGSVSAFARNFVQQYA